MTQRNTGSFANGLMLTFALHVAVFFILRATLQVIAPLIGGVISYISQFGDTQGVVLFIVNAPLLHIIFIGITQFLYVVPMLIWTIQQRLWEFMKGIIVAAVITVLLRDLRENSVPVILEM